jgi:hypothetical protein
MITKPSGFIGSDLLIAANYLNTFIVLDDL